MVAGMLMPRDRLRAIYEILFRDGVMVAKNDERPQSRHAEIPGVTNLQVTKAMGSLKSRGFVRETFAWKHCYWYLTNEGIVYLRQYLHLPPEIVPASLQRVRRPIAPIGLPRRTPAANVQAVRGPTSYVPKPQADVERHEYRRREETVPHRGQDTTHGSFKTHVLENSCQEGGWQRWAERDDQASNKRGTSHTSVLSVEEKWGTKQTLRREEISRRHVGEQENDSYERRGHQGTSSSDSWTDQKMFGGTQGLRKEISKRQTMTENAELVTAPASVISLFERQELKREENVAREENIEGKKIASKSALMSQPQNAAISSSSKMVQKSEESKTVVKSVEVHVVSSVVSTHETLEVSVHKEGGKAPVQEQASSQEKSKAQIIRQEKDKEVGKAPSITISTSTKTKVEASQEVKQEGRDNISDDKYLEDKVVSQTHVPSVSKESEKLQSKKQKQQREEELSVTDGPIHAAPEPPKPENKGEEKKGQRKKGQEKSGKEGANQNNLTSHPKEVQKPAVSEEVKSEPKKEAAIEATKVTPEATPKSEPSKTKQRKSKKEDKTREGGAGQDGLSQGPPELGESKEDKLETKSQKDESPVQVPVSSISVLTEKEQEVRQEKKGSKGKKAKKGAIESAKSDAQDTSATQPLKKEKMEVISKEVAPSEAKEVSKSNKDNVVSEPLFKDQSSALVTTHHVLVEEIQDIYKGSNISIQKDTGDQPIKVEDVASQEQHPASDASSQNLPVSKKQEEEIVQKPETLHQNVLVSVTCSKTIEQEEVQHQKGRALLMGSKAGTTSCEHIESTDGKETKGAADIESHNIESLLKDIPVQTESVTVTKTSQESKGEVKTVKESVTLTQKPPESKKEVKIVKETVTITKEPPETKTEKKTVTLTQKPPESKEEVKTVKETVTITKEPPETKTEKESVTLTQKPPESKKEVKIVKETVTITKELPETKTENETVTLIQKPPESKEEVKMVKETVAIAKEPPETKTEKKTVTLTQKPPESKVENFHTVKESVTLTQGLHSKVEKTQTVSRTVTITQVSKVEEVSAVTFTPKPPESKLEELQTVSDISLPAPEAKVEEQEAPCEGPAEDPKSTPEEGRRMIPNTASCSVHVSSWKSPELSLVQVWLTLGQTPGAGFRGLVPIM
ncbi:uncharacterized protein RB166_007218 [Leptodactylus fuscus]|uniref:uncharacterized protein LOC142199984 n=1 Tax=Leptodactylus fuscus TaxID=238119 RepID=UPI003F4EFD2E